MARYLLVEVDENERAARLQEKLDGVEGINVIGLFPKPTKFCDCEEDTGISKCSKKLGWYYCPTCRKPKHDQFQGPLVNLLDDPHPPVQYWNILLKVREPYLSPNDRTGRKIILKKLEMIAENWAKIQRRKKRRPRTRRK